MHPMELVAVRKRRTEMFIRHNSTENKGIITMTAVLTARPGNPEQLQQQLTLRCLLECSAGNMILES